MISKDRRGNKESFEACKARAQRRGGAALRCCESAQPLVRAAGQRSDFAGELELD